MPILTEQISAKVVTQASMVSLQRSAWTATKTLAAESAQDEGFTVDSEAQLTAAVVTVNIAVEAMIFGGSISRPSTMISQGGPLKGATGELTVANVTRPSVRAGERAIWALLHAVLTAMGVFMGRGSVQISTAARDATTPSAGIGSTAG